MKLFDLRHVDNTTSGSKGNLKKAVVKLHDCKYYIKTGRAGSRDYSGYGIEPVIEVISYEIAKKLNIPCASQEICAARVITNGRESVELASMSKDMFKPSDVVAYAEDFYTAGIIKSVSEENLKWLLNDEDSLYRILLLDFVVHNEDRHNKNLIIVLDNDDIRMSPSFDNGYGLFYDDVPKMVNGDIKVTDIPGANAFYGSFDNALRMVLAHSRGSIEKSLNVDLCLTRGEIFDCIFDVMSDVSEFFSLYGNETTTMSLPLVWYRNVTNYIYERIEYIKEKEACYESFV